MTDPRLRHFAVLEIVQTPTETGYQIVVTTNNPCHLVMRWINYEPNPHIKLTWDRGTLTSKQKVVATCWWHNNEQEEAGDTLIHTFIKEPWPVCETRWFFFWATVDGVVSPSTSAIFSKHRTLAPTTMTFYPDPHPEITSVDGEADYYGSYAGAPWATVHDGAGNGADHIDISAAITIMSGHSTNKWRGIWRTFLLFDTSIIPAGAPILEATLRVKGATTIGGLYFPDFTVCLVETWPLSDTTIEAADYQNLGTALCSDTLIKWNDWLYNDWNEFPLNAYGRGKVISAGITKFGLREYSYDLLNVEPVWKKGRTTNRSFFTADRETGFKPELTVTWSG